MNLRLPVPFLHACFHLIDPLFVGVKCSHVNAARSRFDQSQCIFHCSEFSAEFPESPFLFLDGKILCLMHIKTNV